MDFAQWIQGLLRHHPMKPGHRTPEERQAFTRGVMQRVHALEAQPRPVALRSWSWNRVLPWLAVGVATASVIFGIVWYHRPVSIEPGAIMASAQDLEVLQAFDALDENAMPVALELLVDEVEDMQWMLLAERSIPSNQQRLEQTLEVLDAFDELDLSAEEMDELWLEELDRLEEEFDAEDINARLQVMSA